MSDNYINDGVMTDINIKKYYCVVERLETEVYKGQLQRTGDPVEESPRRVFLLRHTRHPLLDELPAAIGSGEGEGRKGWDQGG